MSILGNAVKRVEDPRMLTGHARYVADVELPSPPAHVTYVRSPFAHARILGIDLDDARSMPGVLDIVTAADIDTERPGPMTPLHDPNMIRTPLATDRVRFVGEPVAAIVTDELAQGIDAAEAVFVDYEPLPAVVYPSDALTTDVRLFDDTDSNVAVDIPAPAEISFDGCEVVTSLEVVNSKFGPAPIEPRVAAAYWDDDGRLVHHLAAQTSHLVRTQLSRTLRLDPEQIRVVIPDVGGGFGAKATSYPEDTILGILAKRVGRPVLWAETRSESMLGLGHARAQIQELTIGGNRDGKITHYRFRNLADAGAYPGVGGLLPMMTGMMATGVYDIPNVEYSARSVATNTSPVCAFRGAGRPEASAAIERIVDAFAADVGMDPAEIRRRNYLANDVFPFTTPTSPMQAVYDSGDYVGSLDRALDAAGYDDLRAEQQRRRDEGADRLLGIGLSTYVEVTANGGGGEYGEVALREDGTVLAKTGSTPFGQGHVTTWAMLISDRLGIPMEDIEVLHGDTDVVPEGGLTGGSRSVQIAGTAMHDAAGKLAEAASDIAADLLEAAPDDVVLDPAGPAFHVVGTPARSVSWQQVAQHTTDPLTGLADTAQDGATFPFGTHVAVVEVDVETGRVELVRYVAVDDAGTIVNPLLAAGQVHGGVASGAAQALMEEIRYDEDGNLLTSNFADYAVISAAELPNIERIVMETPTPLNPLGAKGIGESGTIGATPAVQNAVIDAVAHLGVRHIDMPTTAEKVWGAIQSAEGRDVSPAAAG